MPDRDFGQSVARGLSLTHLTGSLPTIMGQSQSLPILQMPNVSDLPRPSSNIYTILNIGSGNMDTRNTSFGNLMPVRTGMRNNFQLQQLAYNHGAVLSRMASNVQAMPLVVEDDDIIPMDPQHQKNMTASIDSQWMVEAAMDYDLWESLDRQRDDAGDSKTPSALTEGFAQRVSEFPNDNESIMDWNESSDLELQPSLLGEGFEVDFCLADKGVDDLFDAGTSDITTWA